jgi:hypothetical protein
LRHEEEDETERLDQDAPLRQDSEEEPPLIPMRESPMETSYEIIWADDRSPPRSGYLLPLAHPARTTPYTVIPETANR